MYITALMTWKRKGSYFLLGMGMWVLCLVGCRGGGGKFEVFIGMCILAVLTCTISSVYGTDGTICAGINIGTFGRRVRNGGDIVGITLGNAGGILVG